MSSYLDEALDPRDVRDTADLVRRMASEMPFRAGELRVATVENASTDCRALLGKVVRALPHPQRDPGRSPRTTVVLVSARYGRVVPGRQEEAWTEALHFCNEVSVRGMFTADPVLLTQHGWLVLGSRVAGAERRLAAEGPRPVSAARRTSSSRAGSARRSP